MREGQGEGTTFNAQSPLEFDDVFEEVAPGVCYSGNLEHKWGPEGDHTASAEPPSNLKGD